VLDEESILGTFHPMFIETSGNLNVLVRLKVFATTYEILGI
jgi:hypothetical protein